ncbi:MAG: SET domain-containing protein-lysine N-methyltransferase [Candidatus Colwellbacteria bacterium]|nr:SET domain-containing protein-lysine N-methyltransferase [Candidatus Colwellbacteria bacterium]
MGRQYLKRTWVNPKLKADKSKIHGNGVFASEKILRGEKLMEFGGDLITQRQAFSGNYRSRSVWIVSPNHYLALPNSDTKESLDENLNHSCDANAWLTDEVTLVARRDIETGEEITLDQGTWNFEYTNYTDNEEPCFCRAKDCRKVLTETDWKIPSVQERYNGHFHPMIQKMIDVD